MTDSSFKDPTHPLLIVTGGPSDGDVLALDTIGFEKVLGSGPDCHLRLEASNVDFLHARVVWEERGVVISDEGSSTGTYVNGEKAGADRLLADGDRVCLGPPGSRHSVKLLLRVPALATAPAEALRLAPEPEEELVLTPPEPEPGSQSEEVFVVEDAPTPAPPVAPAPPAPPAAPQASAAPVPLPADRAAAAPPGPAVPAPTVPDSPAPAPATSQPSLAAEPPRPIPQYTDEPPSMVPAAESEARRADATRSATPFTDSALMRRMKRGLSRPRLELPRLSLSRRTLLVAAAALIAAGGGLLAYLLLQAPAPQLAAVQPDKIEPGGSVTLTGSGFDARAGRATVLLDERAVPLTAASATQLTLAVPPDLGQDAPANVKVTVKTRGGVSNALILRVGQVPQATRIEPDVALPGEEVVVHGKNLDGKDVRVAMGNVPADVIEARRDSLRVRVPAMPLVEGRSLRTVVSVGHESTSPLELTLGRLPLVTDTQPQQGPGGTTVTLKGRGFGPEPAANEVTFGGERALILTASATELVVVAPPAPLSGSQSPSPIVVEAGGGVSSGSSAFVIVRPSSGTFVPRFVAAPVPDDESGGHAFVSTELGPALLLGDADGAASVAARALAVSQALNEVFARPGTLSFEVRGGAAAVAVAGRADPLVRATAADAAAYAQPWEASMKGQHPSPAELARHWAALLQDFRSLFVEHQRPTRVVELSPRGKALLDLYSESERRSGTGGGVPFNLVSPPTFNLLRDFRDMALALSGRGQATAAAVVTGRWEGTAEEADAGARALQLVIRLDGKQLAGSITTRAGALAMDIPLSDVSYQKGVLSFSVAGGAPRRYRGSVEGSSLTGTIHLNDGKEVGRFKLRYQE